MGGQGHGGWGLGSPWQGFWNGDLEVHVAVWPLPPCSPPSQPDPVGFGGADSFYHHALWSTRSPPRCPLGVLTLSALQMRELGSQGGDAAAPPTRQALGPGHHPLLCWVLPWAPSRCPPEWEQWGDAPWRCILGGLPGAWGSHRRTLPLGSGGLSQVALQCEVRQTNPGGAQNCPSKERKERDVRRRRTAAVGTALS